MKKVLRSGLILLVLLQAFSPSRATAGENEGCSTVIALGLLLASAIGLNAFVLTDEETDRHKGSLYDINLFQPQRRTQKEYEELRTTKLVILNGMYLAFGSIIAYSLIRKATDPPGVSSLVTFEGLPEGSFLKIEGHPLNIADQRASIRIENLATGVLHPYHVVLSHDAEGGQKVVRTFTIQVKGGEDVSWHFSP